MGVKIPRDVSIQLWASVASCWSEWLEGCVCVRKVWLVAFSHCYKTVNHPPTSFYTYTQIGFIITCSPFHVCQSIRVHRERKVAVAGLKGGRDTKLRHRMKRCQAGTCREFTWPITPFPWSRHLARPLKGDCRGGGPAAYLQRIHIILSHPAHR